jgi:hypothetical protein
MGTVTNLGVASGDNALVTPKQLLELALEDLAGGLHADAALIILIDRTTKAPDDRLHGYRASLAIDDEQCLLANQLLRLQLRRLGFDEV